MQLANSPAMPNTLQSQPEENRPRLAYTKSEAASLLGLSVRTIENLIANKELSVRRVGRRVLIPHQSLLILLRHDRITTREGVH